MERTCCLYLLLLILAPANKGEMCHSLVARSRLGPFHCPAKGSNPTAMFCCGTCRQPYCCASQAERLDPEKCTVELDKFTLEELKGTRINQGENSTDHQPTSTWRHLGGFDLGALGNYAFLNTTNQDAGDEQVPWKYIWLLPASFGFFLLCISFSMIVPHLRHRLRTLRCLTASGEVSPDVADPPARPLKSALTQVPNSYVDADPSSPETKSLQDASEMPPGSSNPSEMPPSPPISGDHMLETITLSPARPRSKF
ncbi:uncharacterized protein LOC100555748 [Anolis carolinensis]|uniref:uncharacterized protein LOC100555748 n=1 Tax=Anolis carolinensis TaxID=28377 RepID=UPI000203A7E0|nr:PREDICTED: uncharacterized protein LOC100555748 [Anolis carolinensis]|eukprot:XP_003226463.1 PREDICTED: uncharacterized protein LOC100555748 [Anolis carolinensis]